ncbi:alpha/beta hydrolase [Aliiglaciecola sp. LCG003]|uniref:alpha/beta hydrolase n=1 Tax=Aliiglaciecola sp. LCG003 TaxID=3053655 RepID=UPI002573AF34|nr:alpha/beta hydrolase [Aliiglaciecola sp. LCG003]WJG10930.1 alpha/beta hydrolase [Aliiglaciecola sp. LCG003]
MYRVLAACFILISISVVADDSVVDSERNRIIPIQLSFPSGRNSCSITSKCSVTFLSAGYGVPHTKYQFLGESFTKLGYLVVAIGHELADDPPLSVSGNLFETRSENWQRGSHTLRVVRSELRDKYPEFDFENLVLAGHSNGGDISAWLALESPAFVDKLITLDHRRVPIPRSDSIAVLSVRASDFEADDGVLPTKLEQALYESCILKIPNSRHNDISDLGPESLKSNIQHIVHRWLAKASCQL